MERRYEIPGRPVVLIGSGRYGYQDPLRLGSDSFLFWHRKKKRRRINRPPAANRLRREHPRGRTILLRVRSDHEPAELPLGDALRR